MYDFICVQALLTKFKELEEEQHRVNRSLEETLKCEREKGCGLEGELTNERAESQRLREELERLKTQLQTALSKVCFEFYMLFIPLYIYTA